MSTFISMNIHIPGTNTFFVEGAWVYNDTPATAHSSG